MRRALSPSAMLEYLVGWVERLKRAFTPVFEGYCETHQRRRWVSQEVNPSYKKRMPQGVPKHKERNADETRSPPVPVSRRCRYRGACGRLVAVLSDAAGADGGRFCDGGRRRHHRGPDRASC